MQISLMARSVPVLICAFYAVCVFSLLDIVQGQPTTDPYEVTVLNSVFQKWGVSATDQGWNISGEPCTGSAIDSIDFDDENYNALIKCDCSYNNGSTCHIIKLKVSKLDVVGDIPDELWHLSFMQNLILGSNYLTGPLSSSISNLTHLEYLTVGINALSGELPKELGNLTRLRSLGIGANNFSGSLPSELGNLIKLEQFYFDNSGISGEIPSTFAKLTNLAKMWGTGTELRGRIPDFIGNWSKLTALRLQGNSFEGPIPSTFSNLVSLTELRISEVSGGSTSLEFIKNMTSLAILVLRNNNISDSIPSNIGEFQSLSHLDLSFNDLSGQIPDSLFSSSSLSQLFLGNNKLTGSLPAQKSASLLNIDLSYNGLSGSFPSWVNQQNLQLNLVANNFKFDRSNSSFFPSMNPPLKIHIPVLHGLNCLQRNFPCNRGSGRYSEFAIKCGGPQITSSDRIVYERDDAALGPASYFVTGTSRWAVSNVGFFMGSRNARYTISSSFQFTNTLDPELFRTARLSAGSLRYYGLGLENGNYTLNLQFAETEILDTRQWKSLGKRMFDIYIQGNLVEKDFDIQKEAGGASFRTVRKNFTGHVSENYLEIHLFWAGKGTHSIPAPGIYGPSISAISATPDFIPTVSNKPPTNKRNKTGLIVGVVVAVGVVSILSVFAVYYFGQRRKMPLTNHDEVYNVARRRMLDTNNDEELLGIDARPYTFSYAELRTATEDFSPANKLGEGGFGPVYKGTINDGRVVAVKLLSVASHHGRNQFVTEIATISAVQHRNLVKLYGCCIEGDKRLLVYEYLENKSLDQALFGKRSLDLNWPARYDICIGVARGLAYLHEESRLRIVHRDVKASNILLDSDLNPKISDFGLAKLYNNQKTHISTRIAGTLGYLAPEYAMRGHLTEKADVFGFGVVALEIVSGRPNSDSTLEEEKMYLLEWAWHLHENNHETELVDTKLSDFNEENVKRMIRVALLCTQTSPMLRPPMSRVVAMLLGDIEVSTITSKPEYLTDWKFGDVSSFVSDASTKRTDNSHFSSSASTSMVVDENLSPVIASKPLLHDIVGEGR